jgi:hypothetical protein
MFGKIHCLINFVCPCVGCFKSTYLPSIEISTFGGYEAILFNIQALLNLHPNWVMIHVDVKNIFNRVFQIDIFRKLCNVKGPLASIVPIGMLFYVFILFFTTGMVDMWKGSPLLNHLQA